MEHFRTLHSYTTPPQARWNGTQSRIAPINFEANVNELFDGSEIFCNMARMSKFLLPGTKQDEDRIAQTALLVVKPALMGALVQWWASI